MSEAKKQEYHLTLPAVVASATPDGPASIWVPGLHALKASEIASAVLDVVVLATPVEPSTPTEPAPRKAYVLKWWDEEGRRHECFGVFSTREKAEAAAGDDDYEIEEFDIDSTASLDKLKPPPPPPGWTFGPVYSVTFHDNGAIHRAASVPQRFRDPNATLAAQGPGWFRLDSPFDFEHAEKLGREHREALAARDSQPLVEEETHEET